VSVELAGAERHEKDADVHVSGGERLAPKP
jgi:hypothetical protein